MGMSLKKLHERPSITFADFPQHPATGLVHKIVLIRQERSADSNARLELPLPDEAERGYDRDSPLPQRLGFGQSVQQLGILRGQ
ncbi:hypothetical protein SDC9_204549 [bioreactor metagenome]|uniref:Uncharacterized protein n=1 Tax=bioreactor metagenome TaxID=1076179 RepID=A0A645J079_9ZZZZ